MAKRSASLLVGQAAEKEDRTGGPNDWLARDAMHTLMRAKEIVGDKGLLVRVRKHAAHHAKEMAQVSHQAAQLAKTGHISEKQMAKLAKTHRVG